MARLEAGGPEVFAVVDPAAGLLVTLAGRRVRGSRTSGCPGHPLTVNRRSALPASVSGELRSPAQPSEPVPVASRAAARARCLTSPNN